MIENNIDTTNEILSNAKIAELLDVSINTVKNYKSRKFLPQGCRFSDVQARLAKVKEVCQTVRAKNGRNAISLYRNTQQVMDAPEIEHLSKDKQIDMM